MQSIDWTSIRSLNGSKHHAFEELCCQLAQSEVGENATFVRKGTPDAGVECYAVFPGGDEFAWQAKYFQMIGDAQWHQLDKSVRNAIDKHPRLSCYYVCLPLDRADPRSNGRKSTMDKWNDRVAKWKSWANERKMSVEFQYWGSSELLNILIQDQHRGRLRFFFDQEFLSEEWFKKQIDYAVTAAGPRYTPEIHVKLPIIYYFDALGRTDQFFNRLKQRHRAIKPLLNDAMRYSVDDNEFTSMYTAVREATEHVLEKIRLINPTQIDVVPLSELSDATLTALSATRDIHVSLLQTAHREHGNAYVTTDPGAGNRSNRIESSQYSLLKLIRTLGDLFSFLDSTEAILVNNPVMLLTGKAGTGKSHLLCDVALARHKENAPTILLMGQQFTSLEDPCTQALRLLDIREIKFDEFVDILEVAAVASGKRALVIVDALNEGSGKSIWYDNLSTFISKVNSSKWISLVVSIRSPYEAVVVPEQVRDTVAQVEHRGFEGYEYQAARTFFDYYKIIQPSTPLLNPEFQNPLFLKILCAGLHGASQKEFPRGFLGITEVFELFLSAVNDTLSRNLNYNPNSNLVRDSIALLANILSEGENRWISSEEAENRINMLLPNRNFSNTLYYHLISAGVLMEDVVWQGESKHNRVTLFAYERLSDHLIVRQLLESHLDKNAPEVAFSKGGGLHFVCQERSLLSSGLLEALCVQIPELTGRELLDIAPGVEAHRFGYSEAFRESLSWRSLSAFSEATVDRLNDTLTNQRDFESALDTLLTITMIPNHPFNADFLHERLWRYSMPERDEQWSTYIQKVYGTASSVDRLIDWSLSSNSRSYVDDESMRLCASTIIWFFTSSNRHLRDRATKCVVNLLCDRLHILGGLINQFSRVDDLYVRERLYAVAYGCVMRSNDVSGVGDVAQIVYDNEFRDGTPTAHILLRDYARGVIERACFLKSNMSVDLDKVRPPYTSPWPRIPSKEEVNNYHRDIGVHKNRDPAWSQNWIHTSVMSRDFGLYVFGTSFGRCHWLSLRRYEPKWRSSAEILQTFIHGLNEDEAKNWKDVDNVRKVYHTFLASQDGRTLIIKSINHSVTCDASAESSDDPSDQLLIEKYKRLTKNIEIALEGFVEILPIERRPILTEEVRNVIFETSSQPNPPTFDLQQAQRWIVNRVFELGWTVERFGEFDDQVDLYNQSSQKAERIGKKYQWISCHEFAAYLSDNFQYLQRHAVGEFRDVYNGPWQEHFRDIDPSCSLLGRIQGDIESSDINSWWQTVSYHDWTVNSNDEDWICEHVDLPQIPFLLSITRAEDQSEWLNVVGDFRWTQSIPPEFEYSDINRRQVWYQIRGYLVRTEELNTIKEWAEVQDFYGRWMPEPQLRYEIFLGEFFWSPAYQYFQQPYYSSNEWVHIGDNRPIPAAVHVLSQEYLKESSGLDCSIDNGYSLRLPSSLLLSKMGLKWSGIDAEYIDQDGRVCVFDPTARESGPSAMLVLRSSLARMLENEGLSLFWIVNGEKQVLYSNRGSDTPYCYLEMAGAYFLDKDNISGLLKCTLKSGGSSEFLHTIRT